MKILLTSVGKKAHIQINVYSYASNNIKMQNLKLPATYLFTLYLLVAITWLSIFVRNLMLSKILPLHKSQKCTESMVLTEKTVPSQSQCAEFGVPLLSIGSWGIVILTICSKMLTVLDTLKMDTLLYLDMTNRLKNKTFKLI